MVQLTRSLILSLFLCVLLGKSYGQKRIYTDYFETINVNKFYKLGSSRLFEMYLTTEGKYNIVLPAIPEDSIIKDRKPAEIQKEAELLNCEYYCKGSINRLGESAIVSISVYTTSDGSLLWSDKLKARNPDDLDPIMQKMASNLSSNSKASESDIFSVSKNTSEEIEKNKAELFFGSGLQGYIPINNYPGILSSGISFISLAMQRNLHIQNKFDIIFGSGNYYYSDSAKAKYSGTPEKVLESNFMLSYSLQAFYPFAKKNNFTPFLGGGMGISLQMSEYHLNKPRSVITGYSSKWNPNTNNYESSYNYSNVFQEDGFNAGLSFHLGGGFILNSQSSKIFRISGELIQNSFKINNTYGLGALVRVDILFNNK